MSLPQRRGGRVRGAEGYHREDILALLRCVKDVVPTNTKEWDQVLDEYRKTHAIPNTRSQRDTNSLKVKFKHLARSFRPGVSERPEVQEAGGILDLIEAKMEAGKWLQRRGGRARGAEGFSSADSQAILRIVRQIVPVDRSDWEQVSEEYSRVYAVSNDRLSRDGVSLKSRFRNLLKNDVPGVEVTEALAVLREINVKMVKLTKDTAKMIKMAKDDASLEDVKMEEVVGVSRSVADSEEISADETEIIVTRTETANRPEVSTTRSEDGDKSSVVEPRRGGRAVGSEGYTHSDLKALLKCLKEVLPSGPTGWEQVLQLYRMNHAIPNDRAQRNLTGIKTKFRQLVNWKRDKRSIVPQEVLDARSIQREIALRETRGKRQRSESGSYVSFSRAPEESTPVNRESHSLLVPHTETRNNASFESQNVVAVAARWPVSSQVPVAESVVKRQKQNINDVEVPKDSDGDSVRSEIASRELELLKQREQREAEQAAWEKERAMREKQRMDMETWTIVCDRLRALYRERATENDPEIMSEFDEEIAVLKKKKQRLAGLMV